MEWERKMEYEMVGGTRRRGKAEVGRKREKM